MDHSREARVLRTAMFQAPDGSYVQTCESGVTLFGFWNPVRGTLDEVQGADPVHVAMLWRLWEARRARTKSAVQ